jgi:surface-anchored protein
MYKSLTALLVFTVSATAQTALTSGDVEFSINFRSTLVGTATNPWLLTIRNSAALTEYAGMRLGFADPERVFLQAGDSVKLEVPDIPEYAFLGAPGAPVWILPENTTAGILTPGLSSENRTAQPGWQGQGVSSTFLVQGTAAGSLSTPITLSLATFSGPGDFFLYRTNGFGDPLLAFRTDDGVGAGDALAFSAATHSHYNWAFTAPGTYTIGLKASGTASGGLTESDVTTFRVHIVPEPSGALLLACSAFGFLARRRR